MGQMIRFDEARIRDRLGEIVRGTVEEALNAMLDAEADQLCGAGRYERSEGRQDTRAGSYERALHAKAGEVKLKIPKLRRQTFETAIIERYQRRDSSFEEVLIEIYLAGVSVGRVEDITEALWGARVSPGTVSNLNKKIYVNIEEWREAADLVEVQIDETMCYHSFPNNYRLKIRTDNPLERIMKRIRPRTRVVGAFPNSQSCLNLVARLQHIASSQRSTRKYMNMPPLYAEQTSTHIAVA